MHLLTLYQTLFQPYLVYGITLWGSTNKRYLKPIEQLQKKAIRYITKSAYNSHTQPLFRDTKLLKITDLHKLQVCKFMYQVSSRNVSNSLCNAFTANRSVHEHHTRNRNDPRMSNMKSALAANSMTYKGPQLWHSLTRDMKDSNNVNSFGKKTFDKYILITCHRFIENKITRCV